jgi:hypothetical protein
MYDLLIYQFKYSIKITNFLRIYLFKLLFIVEAHNIT